MRARDVGPRAQAIVGIAGAVLFPVVATATACSLFVSTDGLGDRPALLDGAREADRITPPVPTMTTDAAPGPPCEGDLLSNARHCRRCGRDCGGGSCVAGECEPYVLASALQDPWYMTGDAEFVYVLSRIDGRGTPVYRIDKKTGDKRNLAESEQAFGLALDGEYLLWTTINALGVRRARRDGTGLPETLRPLAVELAEIHVRPEALWVSSYATGVVHRLDRDGDAGTYSGLTRTEGVTSDERGVYLTNGGPFQILRAPFDGGAPRELARTSARPRRLAQDNRYLYWISYDGPVGRIDKATGVNEAADLGVPNLWGGIAVDEAHFYFVNATQRAIYRAPVDGPITGFTPIATNQPSPADIHLDGSAIYWTNRDNGTVMRMVR